MGNPKCGGWASITKHALSDEPSRLHVGGIVHEIQRLKGSVGAGAAKGASFSEWRVEHEHRRVRNRTFPVGVKGSAIEVSAFAGNVFVVAVSGGDLLVETGRVVRFYGGTAEGSNQEPARGEGLISNGFSGEPDSWSS